MTNPLDRLHLDHINLSKLLDVFAEQVDVIGRAEVPDFDLLLGILEYIEHYPDRVHHPNEDRIFRVLAERSAQARAAVSALMEEHRALTGLTRELHGILYRPTPGEAGFLPNLHAKCSEYLEMQRRHLDAEEASVFPLAREVLSEQDWRALSRELPGAEDPLFDRGPDSVYGMLYEKLTEAAG
jgi:hemerythrin-like domain-containing protein